MLAAVAFAVYCLVPHLVSVVTFATDSYLILAVWGILGSLVFRHLLVHDKTGRLGKSTVVWLALLLLVFFASHMWVRHATYHIADDVVTEVGAHYAAEASHEAPAPDDPFLLQEEEVIEDALTRYHLVQLAMVVLALGVMFSIYAVIARREHAAAKAKDYFFSTISHDIRTPINAIVGFTETLRLAPPTTPGEREETLTAILTSSRTLLRIVDDILELSRIETGSFVLDPEPADCPVLVRRVARAFAEHARKAGLDLRVKTPTMPRLLVDAVRLRQIVFQLVGNAIKFTEKGFVEVRLTYTPTLGALVGDLLIEVEDSGVGISAEDIPRIATAYVQHGAKLARNGGTGVGLAVCRQLATAMGGTFTVRSTLGHGTTFSVFLPHLKTAEDDPNAVPEDDDAPFDVPAAPETSAPESPAPAETEATAPAASLPRILIVDDAKMNLMVLKALLKRLGNFDIAMASDGNEALELLRHAGDRPFSLVLTDYWMPNLDGGALVGAIRSDPHLASIPVHVITADVVLQAEYVAKGFDSLLLKPVTLDSLRPLLPRS